MFSSLLTWSNTLLRATCFSRNLARKGSKTEAPARLNLSLRLYYHMLTGAELKKVNLQDLRTFSQSFLA